MRKNDARKLDHQTLETMRIRAVQQIRLGANPEVMAEALGINRATIYDWLARHRAGGIDALRAKVLHGRPRKVAGKQLKWIYDAVTLKNPDQLKFSFVLWTRKIVQSLIQRKFDIKLSLPSIGRLLKQLGLSCQKPLYRATQQDPKRVAAWLSKEYPTIRKQAKQAGATIFFADEAGLKSTDHRGRTWGKRGSTPLVRASAKRFGFNMISAVSARGDLRFQVVRGRVGAAQFLDFIKRLTRSIDGPVFLVVDGHPIHKAKIVKNYIEAQQNKVRLFFLPPYSPELNPDEQVWNDLKGRGLAGKLSSSSEDLFAKVMTHFRSLQKLPERVIKFFRLPETRYASA